MNRVQLALLTFGMLTLGYVLASAQAQEAPKAGAPPATPRARAVPPDAQAFRDAQSISDPKKKIEALQKFLVDYPASGGTATVKRLLVQTLIKTYSGQKEEFLAEVDKLITSAPDSAKGDLLNQVAWELFGAGVLLDEAERFASRSIALMVEPVSRAMVQDTLGQIYLKQGKTAEGEKLFKEALAADPTIAASAAALGDLEQKKGNDAAALDYLVTAAVASRPPAGTQAKLEALYQKLHKDKPAGQGLEAMLDDRYRKLFPTLRVPAFQPPAARSDRTVLAEVFTGSGCPPCVAADLAFDAMLERYPRKDLVVIMYHLHIPAPDPMTNPSTQARSKFYGVRGVPSYILDGELKSGGGSRSMTQSFYDRVNPTVEERLVQPAEASLTLTASLEGMMAKVKADVRQIKGNANNVRLQVALVEEMLSYGGQNGIRLHPVVVRSLAGPEAGGFAVDPANPAAVEHTFDIAKVTEELKTHLDDFEATATGGRKFSQKKHEINPHNLSVVAFVQDQATKKILQSAYVRLKPKGVAANQ